MDALEGIVLWTKNHKEKDKLVKLFTKEQGKIMCYAKGVHRINHPLKASIQPFTKATFIGNFKENGLSFLNASKDVSPYLEIQKDISLSAHATYILGLADAVIDDRIKDVPLFEFTTEALTMLDNGNDASIIMNIYEIQLLRHFGAPFDFEKCQKCGKVDGKFAISINAHGLLCEEHWKEDARRLETSPHAVQLMRLFSVVTYERIRSITVGEETKKEIRKAIDELYQEYVGIHLKSKTFLDQMEKWKI